MLEERGRSAIAIWGKKVVVENGMSILFSARGRSGAAHLSSSSQQNTISTYPISLIRNKKPTNST
jgi:hypothetical protein